MPTDCRTALPAGYTLGAYHIMECVGFGGSALCYRATKCDSAREVILKEIYPYTMAAMGQITRDPYTNRLIVTEGANDILAAYFNRLNEEISICNDLLNRENPYVFFMEREHINNTPYIVIDTTFGQMQSELMERTATNFVKELPSLEDVLGRILRIIEALKPLHQEGYLHGDISPANIHISTQQQGIQAGGRVARLIDFNNAVPLNQACTWRFSSKAGYSATEIISPQKASAISYGSDLYSVTSILFELLYGCTFRVIEHLSKARDTNGKWQHTISPKLHSPYFENIDPEVKAQVQALLLAGLVQRFPDCATLEGCIHEILTLLQHPHRLKSHFAPQEKFFMGRDDGLNWIEEQLNTKSIAIIQGMGGLGKSALARSFAERHFSQYKTIIWAPFAGSILQTICDDTVFTITNYTMDEICPSNPMEPAVGQTPRGEALRSYYLQKLEKLRGLLTNDTLIIMDGLDKTDDANWSDLKTLPCHLIITTRGAFDGCTAYPLCPLQEEFVAASFFMEYNPTLTQADIPSLRPLIAIANGVPLFLELFAKVMYAAHLAPEEMAKGFSAVYHYPQETVSLDALLAPVDQILASVIRLSALSEAETTLLQQFCLLPDSGIPFARAKAAFGLPSFDLLNDLVRKGYLQENSLTQSYTQHAVFADAICKLLKPTWASSKGLRSALRDMSVPEPSELLAKQNFAHHTLPQLYENILYRLPWDHTIEINTIFDFIRLQSVYDIDEPVSRLLCAMLEHANYPPKTQSWLSLASGLVHLHLGQIDQADTAIKHAEQTIKQCTTDKDLLYAAYASLCAKRFEHTNLFSKAIRMHKEALKYYRHLKQCRNELTTTILLGIDYYYSAVPPGTKPNADFAVDNEKKPLLYFVHQWKKRYFLHKAATYATNAFLLLDEILQTDCFPTISFSDEYFMLHRLFESLDIPEPNTTHTENVTMLAGSVPHPSQSVFVLPDMTNLIADALDATFDEFSACLSEYMSTANLSPLEQALTEDFLKKLEDF